MRDVPSGWLLRYIHANGASLFFIVVYLHIFKGFFYSSYARPREALWILGVVILLLMIMTAFIGFFGQKWLIINIINQDLDLGPCL
jgi:quinol-cytochrome oxidoreductase complex cytochrome b subunit